MNDKPSKPRTRLPPETRRNEIFNVIVRVAIERDYRVMTRDDIATAAGITPPLVTAYFGSMDDIRKMIVSHGIHARILPLIGQAMAARDPQVKRLDHETKLAAAVKYLNVTLPAEK